MKLKLYHILIPTFTIPVFGITVLLFGYQLISTITDSNGLWGNAYVNYDLSKMQFVIYTLIVVLSLIGLILSQVVFLIFKNVKKLNKTFLIMAVFVVLWILAEFYLGTRWIGKG